MKYLRKLINFFSHKRLCILDTNILVLREKETLDSRIKKFPYFLGSLFVTEFVETEKRSLVAEKAYTEIFEKQTLILDYESLRVEYPDTCPIFYNFIVGMHNPAHITNPFFAMEVYINLEKTGVKLTKKQKRMKMLVSDMVARSARNNFGSNGEIKLEQSKILDRAYQRYIRKKREADPAHKNYLNDYKTISLAVINCLLKKTNTTFITADSDALIAICNLIETVAQQISFKHLILEKIKQAGVIRLWQGKEKFRFMIKFDDLNKSITNLMRDMFALNTKAPSFFFRIIYWDQEKQKYIECLRLNFDAEIRDLLLHLHGHLACPFVRNCDYGNMFRYRYELRPDMTINVEVLPKTIRNVEYKIADTKQHRKQCKYVERLESNEFKYFTEFEPSNLPGLFDRA